MEKVLKKNKILIVTEYFYPEEFKINDIAQEWKKKGYEVDVLTTFPTYPESKIYDGYKNSFFQKDSWNNITIYRVKSVTGYKSSLIKKLLKYFSFMFFGSIVSLFIGKKYDYIFGFNMAALTSMLPTVVVRKIYKTPVTFWAQDIWPDSVYAYGFKKTKILSFCLDRFVKFMYHNIDNIAVTGKGFEQKLKPYIRKDLKFYYLPNWADDLDMNLDSISLGDSKKTHFTFAGNIGKVQNLDNIIKAFMQLPKSYKDKAQLNIIGDGSAMQELKSLAKDEDIVFHGRKPRSDMARYYKSSDFLIVSLIDKPIFWVTVPAKTQTYIAAKKPILAIINGDGASIVKENSLGFTSNPNDIDEIKNIFIRALDISEKERKNFTKNCEILTKTVFNKDIIIEKLLNLTLMKNKF